MGTPTRSIHRNRRPRSRTTLPVPRTELASHAAPANPPQRPHNVETMYQVGGSFSVAMVESEWRSPLSAAATTASSAARTCPPRKPRPANTSHIQAAGRESGAAPAASWRPSVTSALSGGCGSSAAGGKGACGARPGSGGAAAVAASPACSGRSVTPTRYRADPDRRWQAARGWRCLIRRPGRRSMMR